MVHIHEERCTGCGLCAQACHEAAISIIDGKARLVQEAYCDGLGNCIPVCPTGAITVEAEIHQIPPDFSPPTPRKFVQWPVQITLVPIQATYFEQAHVVIAADCCAYVYSNFHQEFMKDRVILIGCPKLDSPDYREKLREIFNHNSLKSLQVIRMEVPCCGGIEYAVRTALNNSGKKIPLTVTILSIKGTMVNT
ncbi:MAG: 4Fe-4S binding protein [Treponema sp.]|jgi:ferredoxin|nr:4Fe-4S binding protein [Treponema sp.]